MQHYKKDDKGPNCHQEPWKDTRDHSHTEEHQDDVLYEHFRLKWQANINWKKIDGDGSLHIGD